MPALYELSLTQAREALIRGEASPLDLLESCLDRVAATEPKIHALARLRADEARAEAEALAGQTPTPERPLLGIPMTVKDVICLQGSPTACGSRILENFVPFYDAEVVSRLKRAGAVLIGQANMDEFAMGSTTETSCFGRTANPWDLRKVPGGSSGGSAAGVVAGQCYGSLGSDTGGSVRQPAALCGCVGVKPTYGRVSRFGVVAYGSSFDQVGPLARGVEDCARILEVVAGPDPKDSTSARLDLYPENLPAQDFVEAARSGAVREPSAALKGLKIGVPQEFWESGLSPEVEACCRAALERMEAAGAVPVPLSLPHQKYAVAVYYIMASAEAGTNLARFDGIRYGRRAPGDLDLADLYKASRSQGFGPEVRRRIMLGAFVLSAGYYDAYYRKAAQIRRLLREDFDRALERCDLLAAPVTPSTAWDFGYFEADPLKAYKMDLLTVTLNLVGLPGVSLPVGLGAETALPVGIQLMGRAFDEAALLRAAAALEQLTPPLGPPRGI